MEEDAVEGRTGEVKIWTGKLKMKGERGREGLEVDARIVLGASVLFEIKLEGKWQTAEPKDIHADSWLRALAETGTEVP